MPHKHMSSAKERTGIQRGMSFIAFNLLLGAEIRAGRIKKDANVEEVSGIINGLLKARGSIPVKAHYAQSFFKIALSIEDLLWSSDEVTT